MIKELAEMRGGHGWLSFAPCIPAAAWLQRQLQTSLHRANGDSSTEVMYATLNLALPPAMANGPS
ncbi:hypothetical protein [Pseudarthrobacter sp. MDT3-1]